MGELIAEMQERLLPEYEQMKHYQIFTSEQIRECVHQRERLLLNITKSKTSVKDYMDFISFEKELYKKIGEKEKKSGHQLSSLKTSISIHIVRMYRAMLDKFPEEERLWDSYIKCCKKSAPQDVAGIYEKRLSHHGDDPEAWQNAAKWLYKYNPSNIERVQDILTRGLQRHARSTLLYKCSFDIQLNEAAIADSQLILGQNTISEQQMQLERVLAVYRNSLNHITDLDYFLKLLESCEDYRNLTINLQHHIIEDLQSKFPREPALWDALAKRELRGFHLGDLQAQDQDKQRMWTTRSKKRCIELCVTVYKTAVEQLQVQEMWSLYLDTMLHIARNKEMEREYSQQCLATALKDGHCSHLMHSRYYATLCRMLGSTKTGIAAGVRILTEALEHKQSLQMQQLLLHAHIRNDDEPCVRKLFTQLRRKVIAEDLPLWQSVIQYYQLRDDLQSKRQFKEIYMQACKVTLPQFAELRCSYLRYVWHKFSPSQARIEYDKLAVQPPLSLQLHREMIQLIKSTKLTDLPTIKSWRICHEFLANQFGKSVPSVWIDYIAFERDHGEIGNIALLKKRACSTLNKHLVSIFDVESAV